MHVSKLGGHNSLATSSIRMDKSTVERLKGTKPNKVFFDKETIEENFSNRAETATPAVEVSFDFNEARKAGRKAAIDSASGEEKKDLEMRMYWREYSDIFSGGSPNGWGKINMDAVNRMISYRHLS